MTEARRVGTPRRSGTFAVAAVCVAMLVDMLLYSVVVPVLPVYARELGASTAAIGLLFAVYAVGLVLATPILGMLSDRIGRRRPMLVGSFGLVAATILFAMADSYSLLVTARFVQGVAAAAVWTAGVALVAEVTDARNLGKVMGVVMACMSAGLIIGPPVGGLLEQAGDHRTPFLVVAVVAVLSGLTQFFFIHDPVRGGGATARVRVLLADPVLRSTVIAVFLASAALSMLEPILPLDLTTRLAAGPVVIGLVFGAATLANGATSPLAGMLADRYPRGRRRLMAGGLLAAGALMPTLIILDTPIGVAGVLSVFAIAYGFVLVPALPELAVVAQRHGGGAYAAVYGTFNIVYSLGMAVGPLAGGVGAEWSLSGTLALAGIVLGVGGLLLLYTPRRERPANFR
ncbi:MAG: MFS transporter [Actinomycetota bacterium]|nr:MFS transporter [Actinomycetota bacterium]